MAAPRPRRRPAAVIFDMDGLLLDTEPLAARAWTDAAAALGVEFDVALALAMVGRNFGDCAAMVRARYGARYPVDALLDRWHATYDAIVARDGLRVKPGAIELIDWLERNAIPAPSRHRRRERARAKLVTRHSAVFATSSAAMRSRAATRPTSTSGRAPPRRRAAEYVALEDWNRASGGACAGISDRSAGFARAR
jgi:beta-phosphoglucomutase-like phosphatase (HAD superfamily)